MITQLIRRDYKVLPSFGPWVRCKQASKGLELHVWISNLHHHHHVSISCQSKPFGWDKPDDPGARWCTTTGPSQCQWPIRSRVLDCRSNPSGLVIQYLPFQREFWIRSGYTRKNQRKIEAWTMEKSFCFDFFLLLSIEFFFNWTIDSIRPSQHDVQCDFKDNRQLSLNWFEWKRGTTWGEKNDEFN